MSILRKPLNKVLGDPVRREIKRYEGVVELINELEADMSALSDEELRDKTREFRERLGVEGADITHGQSFAAGLGEETEEMAMERAEASERERQRALALDELLPEAFAVVREASKRTLGMRHFDVQLIGGIVLHQGRIAEMKTGEGKTLVATLALYLNALEGRGAHLVTVNDYLARRDAGWNAALYHSLGMSVGVIAGQDLSFVYDPDFLDDTHPDPRLQHLRPCSRREAYAADITYSTNNELGFDYLRDNMAQKLDRCVQRRLHYAIVDEVELDPHRRGTHAADHQRPGERGDRQVLHVRAPHPAARRGGRLHDRREDQVGDPHRGGRREDREMDRDLERVRHGARRRGASDQPGAARACAVAARPRLHRARRRGDHRR